VLTPNPFASYDRSMEEAANWRFELAERIGSSYARDPNAAVVMVAGSVGRGSADRYSDIEIDVYYERPPTEAERVNAVRGAGGTLVALGEDEDEWEERMAFGGFEAHTSTFLVPTMERYLREVLDEFDTGPAAQTRLFSVLNAVPLKGEAKVGRWRARAAAYPDELRHAMLAAHLDFEPFRYGAEMLAARDDRLALYELFLETARGLLGALFGLNRIYLPTYDYLKWMDEWVRLIPVKPTDLARRLERVFELDPPTAVGALEELIDETLALVGEQLPEFDAAPFRAAVKRRLGWDGMPAA
jgi:hypothetical protein